MIYGIIVLSLIGTGNFFNFFYICAGIFLMILSLYMGKMNGITEKVIVFAVIVFILFFICIEIRIIAFAKKAPEKDADYLIVLGSQMKESGPSVDYRARLDCAYEYLVENQDTVVITTGAQGDFEPVSEAKGGADYLTSKGISEDRIIIEDGSCNTLQNLSNAYEKIRDDGKDPGKVKTVIVSAVYHLYRASYCREDRHERCLLQRRTRAVHPAAALFYQGILRVDQGMDRTVI